MKTKLIKPATKRLIVVKCPDCGEVLIESVPRKASSGKDFCGYCGAEFDWSEAGE